MAESKLAESAESIFELVNRLAKGLPTVDTQRVTQLVTQLGMYNAARVMGYDVAHYNNLLMAGRLAIENLRLNSPKTLLEYAHLMKARLNKMTYDFIIEHHEELQAAIDRNSERDYDHDWFSANTMITMYSANRKYEEPGIETPQYTWMRIAIQLYHDTSVEAVIRAYEEMSVGWYTPASPTIFNAGMREPQMASCLVEGTEVCTTSGVKTIETVSIEDRVITHTGAMKRVSQIHMNPLGDRQLFDLTCWKTPTMTITGNHRVLALKRGQPADWVPVDQLTKDHYVAVPRKKLQLTNPLVLKIDIAQYLPQIQRGDHVVYEYEVTQDMILTTSATTNQNAAGLVTIRHKDAPIKRYLNITHDVATAIGMWYGDGCIQNRKDRKVGEQHICGLNIVAEEHNARLITFWVETMTNFTGIAPTISRKTNLIYAEVHSPIIGEVFNLLFGKGFAGKRLHPTMFQWSASMVKSFMVGLMSTDGCVASNGEMTISMTNCTLVKQIYHLCRQVGVDISYNQDDHLRKGATNLTATLGLPRGWIQPRELYKYYSDDRLTMQISPINTNGSYHDETGQVYLKVKNIVQSTRERPEYVYTLGVDDDHSYNAEGLVVENCFLLTIDDDLESILKTGIYRAGMISKASGGLGFDVSRVRHSEIRETGWSNGIIPMLAMYNNMVRYVDQGGRRKGAATIFLRPHHIDVEDFIELPRKVGDKYVRAHDLNICLWTSWLFWERVRTDGKWTLFCPARVPQLNDLYGTEFTKAYLAAEEDPNILPRHKKVISARDLYNKILNVQRETGMPYLMNGDAANLKSNHRHLGYIRSSNLCLEVIEYTDDETIAVCNLHSLSLRMFGRGPVAVPASAPEEEVLTQLRIAVDFQQLAHISRRVVANLNKVIDHNWYPLDKIKNGVVKPKLINKSNKRHRPVGMGVAGFAELLHILDLPFEDTTVTILNKMLFACMYWNALAQSVQLAIREGPYESFHGSPTSQGKLQFDLWKEEFKIVGPNAARKESDDEPVHPSVWGQEPVDLYTADGESIQDIIQPTWDDLKRCIMKYGLRNSLLIALMPTASTAQIRRNCESVEAHQNNMYSRKVLKCSYPVLNRYLVDDLEGEGVWNPATVEYIRVRNGSIQGFTQYVLANPTLFPNFSGAKDRLAFLEKKYKTMWEIPQKRFMKLAADRGRYIDQSSSTNVYIRDCTDEKLSACHLYANQLGLKTLIYYLRQQGGESVKFTADPTMMKHIQGLSVEGMEQEKKESPKSDEEETNFELDTKRGPEPEPRSKKTFVCTDEVCVSCT